MFGYYDSVKCNELGGSMLQEKDNFGSQVNKIEYETACFHIWRKAEIAKQGKVINRVPWKLQLYSISKTQESWISQTRKIR